MSEWKTIDPAVRKMLESAFVAGFGISGEGWNGEHPFENREPGEMRKEVVPYFNSWLEAKAKAAPLPSAPTPPMKMTDSKE